MIFQDDDRLPDTSRDSLSLIEARHQHRKLQVARMRLVQLSVGDVGHGDGGVASDPSLQQPCMRTNRS
jgi:hypothetical protein